MIIRFVKMSFQAEHVNDFIQFEKSIYDTIRSSEGCEYLQILQDKNNPQIFFTQSHWQSEEFLNQYRHSDFFKETWTKVKKWFNNKPEAWSLEDIKEL